MWKKEKSLIEEDCRGKHETKGKKKKGLTDEEICKIIREKIKPWERRKKWKSLIEEEDEICKIVGENIKQKEKVKRSDRWRNM